ncbi:acyl-CoA N-acyltransferase, partial [Massariosphaeria phaeospora]
MAFILSEVDVATDFAELMSCMWAAHESPPQPFFRLFCPILHADRDASLRESTARFAAWHQHDAHARWLKVTEAASGRIVGAAWYKIYEADPFAQGEDEDEVADWYPEDSTREFATQAIAQMERPRVEKGRRPQVFLNILFTHPGYRRRGIGSMLLEWGLQTAKDLGVEVWLNATPQGKPLYEKYGFEVVVRNPLVPTTVRPDAKWSQIEQEMGEIVFWTM